MPNLYFEGGGGGELDLKAEEVSLPSKRLLYYFIISIGCQQILNECMDV